MPLIRLAVAASLAGNAVLGAVFLLRQSPPVSAETSYPASAALDDLPASSEPVTPAPIELTTAEIGPFLTDPSLSDVELVARLRAAGLPIDAIRIIVYQRIHARFANQWHALIAEARDTPYWEPGRGMPPDLRRKIQALSREERDARITLLGDDAFAPLEWGSPEQSSLDFLAPAKRTQLSQLLNDYKELQQDLMAETMGMFSAEDHEILAFLGQEQESEISTLLSPEELAEYQTRSGPAALQLQRRIQNFEASESEYRRLLELFASSDAAAPNALPLQFALPEQRKASSLAWNELAKQFTAELPPERAELWELTMDTSYNSIDRFVQTNDLDSSVTLGLARLNRDLTPQRRDRNSNMTEAQATLELTQLVNRIEQDLIRLLPDTANRQAYMRTAQGRRIANLKRKLDRP